tara:strand:- start:1268 stop:1558 length:291 start_codon:yes stop_codon:yes gene_type:complete
MTPEQKVHKKEYDRLYKQTPNGKKVRCINQWKSRGLIYDDFDKLYSLYIATTECNVCHKIFTDKNVRCLDHCHDTGAYRNVLCNACNVFDNWAKKA